MKLCPLFEKQAAYCNAQEKQVLGMLNDDLPREAIEAAIGALEYESDIAFMSFGAEKALQVRYHIEQLRAMLPKE